MDLIYLFFLKFISKYKYIREIKISNCVPYDMGSSATGERIIFLLKKVPTRARTIMKKEKKLNKEGRGNIKWKNEKILKRH